MIPSGLKVGDTFTDNGIKYKVLEIVEEGYISTVCEDAEIAPEPVVQKKRTRKE